VIQYFGMKIIKPVPLKFAAVSAVLAGVCFIIVGLFHPTNVSANVASPTWIYVHYAAILMCFFGTFGIIGLYAKQAEKAGWLGLIGTVLLSGWFVIVTGFSFIEAFVLPKMKSGWLAYVDSFLAMFNGKVATVDMGILPILWNASGPMLILGLLLSGIAIWLAGVLPRYAGALLGASSLLIPLAAFIPADYQSYILLPIGVAFVWLGVASFLDKGGLKEKSQKATKPKEKVPKEPLPNKIATTKTIKVESKSKNPQTQVSQSQVLVK